MGIEQDRVETILSVVDNYTREIERYRNELSTVSRQVSDLGNTSGGATSGVEKLISAFGGLKGILAGLGIALSIKEIFKLGKTCIDSASEIKELDNVLEQVFERGQESVVKWADSVSTNIGRASFAMQKNSSIFGAMFKGAGIKTDDLHGMSLDLAQLAADFSSFYDGPMQEVFNAIKSGITGETEPLKRYGIILNETTAAEYALSQGIKTKWTEMSEAQKQIVRYNFLMDKTKFVQGDAERTIDSYANQVKVLEAYFDNISRTLGQKFIPAGEDVLHVVNNMMGALDKWINKPDLGKYIKSYEEEKQAVEDLYAEFKKLSEAPQTDISAQERLSAIIDELNSKYPGLLDNIKKENGAYEGVDEAIQGIIASLNEKINMQILEDFNTEIMKLKTEATKEIDKLQRDISQRELELKVKFKSPEIDKLLSQDFLNQAKNMDSFELERIVKEVAKDSTANLKAQQELYSGLLGVIESKLNFEKGKNQIILDTEKKADEVFKKTEGFIETFEKLNNADFKNLNAKVDTLTKKDELERMVSQSNIRGAERANKIAGVVRDSKGDIVGEIDGTKKALTTEMVQGFLETNSHITIMGENIHTTISKGINGMYHIVQRNAQNGVVVNETDKNLQALENAVKGFGITKKEIDINAYKKTSGNNTGKSKNSSKKEGKVEKDKWEQMLESLNKQIKEFSITSQESAGKIKNARTELDKLEITKIIDFRDALDWSNAEVLQSFIKIKETSRELARTLGDKGAVEQYTQEIKKLNEQLYFANTSKDYKKKTEEMQYNIKSDDNKQVYNELIQNMAEYFNVASINLEERYNTGLDDYSTYLDKQLKLLEGIEETFDKLGLSNKKLAAIMEKETLIREKNQNSVENQIKEIKAIAKYTDEPENETNKKIADVYKNSTETIAKSIFGLTKQLEDLEKNMTTEVKIDSEDKELPVQGLEKIDKSAEELQTELIFINSEIKNFQSILMEVNKHLSVLPENLKTKQEKDFENDIERWKKMLNNAYVKKEQLEYSLGQTGNIVTASGKKDGEETGLLTTEDKRILERFNTKLDNQLEKIDRGINIDFSHLNTIEDVQVLSDEIKKALSNLTGPENSNKNKALREGYGLLLSTLDEVLKTDTKREVVDKKSINNLDVTEIQRILDLIAKYTGDLEEAKKNEKEYKEKTRVKDLEIGFQKGIEDLFLNINASDIQNSLISGVKDLFDKAVQGTDISGIYNKKFSDAFGKVFEQSMEGYTPTGNYLKDQEEQQKRFINALKELATSSDSAVRSIANLTLFDTVKGQLDELAQHLSNAGEVLKDDFLKNLAVTVESLSALAESLKNTSLTSNSKIGGMLGGIGGFLSNVTSGIGMVTGLVSTGVGLFRSAGNLLGFGSSKKQKAKNEEERKKAAEWYEKQFKENESLLKGINDLTNSIIDLNTKLIQNIASNTSDKNINKQKSYYDNLIKTTGGLFDENISATGHSTKKKKKLFGSKTKDSYSTLNQGFDEYFGDAWKNTARDSKSLEQFYDAYLKNFDMNNLKRKLGKNSIDNSNIDQVKSQFLRFVDDIKTMETHSKNLPKNGILESFDGVEVLDVFELRNEYQKQLENIYKGMGKDPEKYKEEILQQVNALIQNGETIISAFNDVKSSFYGKIIEGDNTILSLGTGLESYFTKLRTNISKVFYDINFQGLEESFNNKFKSISDKLADFRLSGGKDLSSFVNNNLNFWDEFTQLKSTENIKNDMKEVLDILKAQAKGAGLSDEVINAMFPDSEINKKADDIKNALEKAMRDALDTNSFSQFSMSLGDSIYNNVKDGLIEAFYESETFKGLAEKYFLNDDYKNALNGAGSFKDAYDIIKQQLDKAEIQLQAEGLDFKGTNAKNGEYYGGLSNNHKTPTGLLANDININYTLNNYGFLDADTHLKKIVKIVKEELHESKKKEV